ncbi:MAG TPA: hypothetical protein VGA98_04535 [Allosphingosinicella sp.]|jgi:hypothetical protein
MTAYAFAGLLLLGLPACTAEPGENASGDPSATNAAAPAGSNAAAAAAPAARSPLLLEGAGLGIPDASPPRIVSFNTPKAAVIEALTKALGRPPTQVGENSECGGGGLEFAEWKDEITLYFQEGAFSGWDSKGELKTTDGIGLGSSRSDVEKLAGFEAEESTLGTEFRAGGLSGLLASKAPGAKVTALWGGTTCVFR